MLADWSDAEAPETIESADYQVTFFHTIGPSIVVAPDFTVQDETIVVQGSTVDTTISAETLSGMKIIYDPLGAFADGATVNGDLDIIGEWIA